MFDYRAVYEIQLSVDFLRVVQCTRHLISSERCLKAKCQFLQINQTYKDNLYDTSKMTVIIILRQMKQLDVASIVLVTLHST